MKPNPIIKQGMILTWWAVASVMIGAVIRIEFVPTEYVYSFNFAALVYGFGWSFTVLSYIANKTTK